MLGSSHVFLVLLSVGPSYVSLWMYLRLGVQVSVYRQQGHTLSPPAHAHTFAHVEACLGALGVAGDIALPVLALLLSGLAGSKQCPTSS